MIKTYGVGMFIVTANLLSTGQPVYWCQQSKWVDQVYDAQVFSTKDEASTVTTVALAHENVVCDPFVAKISNTEGGITLAGQKLTIRQHGAENMLRSIGLLEQLEPNEGEQNVSV